MLAGFEFRIILDQQHDPSQPGSEILFKVETFPAGGLRCLDSLPGLDDPLEEILFVGGVGPHRFDQLRHQVPAFLELHVNRCKGVPHLVPATDKPIVHDNGNEEQDSRDDAQGDQKWFHSGAFIRDGRGQSLL